MIILIAVISATIIAALLWKNGVLSARITDLEETIAKDINLGYGTPTVKYDADPDGETFRQIKKQSPDLAFILEQASKSGMMAKIMDMGNIKVGEEGSCANCGKESVLTVDTNTCMDCTIKIKMDEIDRLKPPGLQGPELPTIDDIPEGWPFNT